MSDWDVSWHCHTAGTLAGTPMLFLHGFMGDGRVWLPIMNQMSDIVHGTAVDLPGHGQTKADLHRLDFNTLADALRQFIDDRFGRPVLLVGYSLGGRVALYTALRHPDCFSGLVLESSTAGIEDEQERQARLTQDSATAEKLRQDEMRLFLTQWYQQPLFAHLRPEIVAAIINKKSEGDPSALAEVVMRLSPGRQPALWNQLSSWTKPTLIIAGELDDKYCGLASRMAGLFSSAQLKILPGAGHIVHLENRADFVAVLKSFAATYIW